MRRAYFAAFFREDFPKDFLEDFSCVKTRLKTSSPSIHPEDYRPISITPALSKIFERLVCNRLMKFVKGNHLLPDGQFVYRKGLGSCDALLSMITVFQDCLDKDSECVAVSLDFSAAFDRVNHKALLYKLQLIGIGGPFLKIIENFISSRVQCVKMDGISGSFSDLVSGVPQGSVLGPILFILFTSDMFNVVQNSLIAYADDATLFAPISSPDDRISVNYSLNSDLLNIYEYGVLSGV